jgi:hypothetical protein
MSAHDAAAPQMVGANPGDVIDKVAYALTAAEIKAGNRGSASRSTQ